VLPLSIRDIDRDKETGEYQFPEIPLMRRLRAALAKQSGVSIKKLLAEQENRVPQALPETAARLSPPQQRQLLPQPNRQQQPRATPLPDKRHAVVRRYRIPEQRIPEG
jgi:hypothetical protein